MLRSILIALILLSYSMLSHAMQPVSMEGTSVSSAYFKSNIDVLSENVYIDVSEHFKKAHFTVQYKIYNKKEGKQIPLLFVLYNDENATKNSKNNVALSVIVDGHIAAVQNISSSKKKIIYDDFFEGYQITPYDYKINHIEDDISVFPDYTNFIEADLSVGYHNIVANYDAMPSYRDTNALIYDYNYDYSFDPIKLKQNFANTTVSLNFDGDIEKVNFQVFPDSERNLIELANNTITFEEDLPETINFSYQRQFPTWVEALVKGPALGFFILFCVLAARWHIKEIRKTSDLKLSSILGYISIASIFIPFISIIAYTIYRFLAYTIIKAQVIDDMLTVFGFLAYIILFLCLAPFYLAFIYYKYSKNRNKKIPE